LTNAREKMAQFIAAQRGQFAISLAQRVTAIESLWAAALAGDDPTARLKELHRLAHTIHGTAGTYGFPESTQAAHALEDAVKPWTVGAEPPDGAAREAVTRAIADLRATLPP